MGTVRSLRASEETCDLFEGALRGGEADPLQAAAGIRGGDESLQAFERKGKVGAALAGNERVDLVHDDGFDGAELLAGRAGQHQVERLRCGDEDFAGMAVEARTLPGGSVAGADADLRHADRDAFALRPVGDAGERRTQVALDVDRECLERGEIEHPAAA